MSQHKNTAHRRKRSSAKHRKPSAGINTTKVATAAAGAVLIGGGVAHAVTPPSWLGSPAALNHVAGGGLVAAASPSPSHRNQPGFTGGLPPLDDEVINPHRHTLVRPSPSHSSSHPPSPTAAPTPTPAPTPTASPSPSPTASGYANPLRAVSGLIPERIDMGVDFGGSGPVYAIGDAVITNAEGDNAGWPGGGWITYQLTSGPAKGLVVYVAEDVTPAVAVGQDVNSSTVIANMYNGGAGIETGWAMPDSASAESQLAVAGGISGGGPFPTKVGLNFEELLQSLGVPAASNRGDAPSGLLPPGYPTSW